MTDGTLTKRNPPNPVVGAGRYVWKHRSGALLWVVLTTMVTATIFQNWPFFLAMAGTGVYVELVHIRTVLKRLLDPVLAGDHHALLLRMMTLTLIEQQASAERPEPRT